MTRETLIRRFERKTRRDMREFKAVGVSARRLWRTFFVVVSRRAIREGSWDRASRGLERFYRLMEAVYGEEARQAIVEHAREDRGVALILLATGVDTRTVGTCLAHENEGRSEGIEK
jgi:hypothetical protein